MAAAYSVKQMKPKSKLGRAEFAANDKYSTEK